MKTLIGLLAAMASMALTPAWAGAAEALRPATDDAAARVESLLSRMTADEKLGLLTTYFPPFSPPAKALGATPSAGFNPGVPRLGVPALRESDASLGVANGREMRKGDTATALPSGLAIAASFDPELARAGGAMIGAEARAKTFNMLLAGGANLTRDPWAGRDFEYLGEDPLLTGIMAGAAIAGVQSNRIGSTAKHFALNPQETGRMVSDAVIDPVALHESDLLAFEIAIERGRPAAIMCAYNKVGGDYACENRRLLTDILRGDWGYRGWVMSDWGAAHSTEKALRAGLDQESGVEIDRLLNHAVFFADPLKAAVASGRVAQAEIDGMARRILTGMAGTGMLDTPVPTASVPIDAKADAAVAQRVAEAGIVLLRNEGGVLPLARSARRILVVGGHADIGVLSGGGSSQVRSVGGVPLEVAVTSGDASSFASQTWHASSPLRALQAAAPQSRVSYLDGRDLAATARAARDADIVVVFATQWRTEGEDLQSLSLPDGQDALIDAVAAANPRTVVVLETGGPVLMPWLARVPAVLEAWYPGQRGGQAIARVLLGEVNPSGRLPMSFPASADQAPRPEPGGAELLRDRDAARAQGRKAELAPFQVDYPEGADVGYRWYERTGRTPLFPFGYGLSYTRFRYANLRVSGGAHPVAILDVTNKGARAGVDTPQVYVQARGGQGAPTWRLAGFTRLELEPGRTRRVSVALEPRTYAGWSEAKRAWTHVEGAPYPVAVGSSATAVVLRAVLAPVENSLAKRPAPPIGAR